MNYDKLTNIPNPKTSDLIVDSNIDVGEYEFMKNGVEVIGLSNNSVTTSYIADNAVTDSKIDSMNYNKLIDLPTTFSSRSGTLTIDSDIT